MLITLILQLMGIYSWFTQTWTGLHGVVVLSDEQRSGSIGNTTYGHNKGGQYARARTAPTNPNTSRQQQTRTVFGSRASAWKELTPTQRLQWDTYSQTHTVKNALGQDVFISGMAWYVMFNSRLADAGATLITTPPPQGAPTGLDTLTVTFTDADTLNVAFTPALSGTYRIQLWQTPPGGQGASPNFNQSRLVGYSAAGQASPGSMESPFAALDNQLSVFFGRIMDIYGQVSALQEDSETYTAP